MITSNTRYPFGGKVGTVETQKIRCMVSTAKAGIFSRQSTRILDCAMGSGRRELVATFKYSKHVGSKARLELHDAILAGIDAAGTSGADLTEALVPLSRQLINQDLATMEVAPL